jgi:hypothetical protein
MQKAKELTTHVRHLMNAVNPLPVPRQSTHVDAIT